MNLMLLGAPGSGKGTQAVMLSETYGLAHLSTGDILRSAVAERSDIGLKAKAAMDRGELVSNEIILALVSERMDRPDAQKGVIFDGFPRTLVQAEALKALLEQKKTKLDAVIMLDVKHETLYARIETRAQQSAGGARADDNAKTLSKRLDIYLEETAPLIEYYERTGLLKKVDGMEPADEVFAQIRATIEE